jgi:predicted YcjX-like family ATPase
MDQKFKNIVCVFFRGSFVTSNRNIILFDALCRLPEGIDNMENDREIEKKVLNEQKENPTSFAKATHTETEKTEKKT